MSPAKRDDGSEGVGGLDRAAAILGAFDSTHRELTLAALVARSGLPRSTTHRVADRMIKLGWLDKPKDRYRVGNRLFEISSLAPIRHELREAALPFLQDLYTAAKTTVQLGVLEGTQVLVVERITGHRPMPMLEQAGGKIPAHCSALGRAILAYSDAGRRSRRSSRPACQPRTPRTLTSRVAVLRELTAIPRPGLGGRPGRGQHRRSAAWPRPSSARSARSRRRCRSPARPAWSGPSGSAPPCGWRAAAASRAYAARPRRLARRHPGSVPMSGTGICLRRGTALTL